MILELVQNNSTDISQLDLKIAGPESALAQFE
jgi:hypothetical protein